jgi:hypothetical protein
MNEAPMPMWKNMILALLAITISAAITVAIAKAAELIAAAIRAGGLLF